MKIFLRDLWRKCGKGLNIFNHWEELCGLDAYLWRPFLMLSVGAVLVFAGDMFGLWALLAHQMTFTLPGHFFAADVVWMLYILLPVLPVTILGQEMFMARSRSSKANDAWWVYLYRYIKGIAALLMASLVSVVIGIAAIPYILKHIELLMQGPKTAKAIAMLMAFGGLGLTTGLVLLAVVILICVALTYGLAFIMQGKSVYESMRKGLKLLRAHWMYTTALMLLQFGVTSAIEWMGMLLHTKFPYTFIFHGIHFAMAVVFLLYWALLFSYHKRISKVPTTR